MSSIIRQNFHEDCEAALNNHINLQLHISYVFTNLSHHFARDDVALPGFSKYFEEASRVANNHAETLMKYQNKRGGRLELQNISAQIFKVQNDALPNVVNALDMQKKVNKHLLEVRQKASDKGDSHMCHIIDDHILVKHVDTIKELGYMITKLKRVGSGFGLYIFDKELN
ncbi:ferritin, heavy subunit-like [Macrobrachium rosenbergii]|uniref:ferritin, heavy subunit-like n=1 Tax=Macrobrachium rosenbergii TaxID=79674 RepID=UPI0034D45BC8